MKYKYAILLTAAISLPAISAPLDIDPSNPPSVRQLDNEKARINLVNQRMDELVQIHGTIKEAETLALEDFMPELNRIMGEYSDWKDDLFLIKTILSDIDQLTGSQEEQYRAKIINVMQKLYDIQRDSYALRQRVASVAHEVSLVREFSTTYIDYTDINDFPTEEDVFTKLNLYRADILTALRNIESITNSELESKMSSAILQTKNIVDELFLIRSLDYPNLANKLEELKSFTIKKEVIEPKLREVTETKNLISSLLAENRPYLATDTYEQLVLITNDLKDEIDASSLSDTDKEEGKSLLSNALLEAANYIAPANLMATLRIQSRYADLGPIANICADASDTRRFNYSCASLKGIYGLNQETVASLSEEKLRYLEIQMDKVYAGPM